MSKLKCGIIGFGGLGKGHFNNILTMEDVELTSLCDVDESQFTKATATNQGSGEIADTSKYHKYTDAAEMLDKEELDFVIIALPTYLHAEYTIMALDKGVHVLCEKPMARSIEECDAMIEAARRNNKLLTIGQCVRYNVCHKTVKEAYESGKYGKLLRLELARNSHTPVWGWENWYMDFEKSGGCALDLHVHDIDFVNYMLGRPEAVRSDAIHHQTQFGCISTQLYYKNVPIVKVTGDWSHPTSYGFNWDLLAVFEEAVIVRNDKGVRVCHRNGEETQVEYKMPNPTYALEQRKFIDCIKQGIPNDVVPMESTKQTIEIVMAEMESANKGEIVKM